MWVLRNLVLEKVRDSVWMLTYWLYRHNKVLQQSHCSQCDGDTDTFISTCFSHVSSHSMMPLLHLHCLLPLQTHKCLYISVWETEMCDMAYADGQSSNLRLQPAEHVQSVCRACAEHVNPLWVWHWYCKSPWGDSSDSFSAGSSSRFTRIKPRSLQSVWAWSRTSVALLLAQLGLHSGCMSLYV